ncbi:MAG: SRPBCC family protein [Halobacteriota archaeon]
MTSFKGTIEIEAPIDYVFAFSTDPTNWPKTSPSLSDFEIVEETEDGYLIDATYRMLGMSIETEMESSVVEENAHTRTVFESDDMNGEMHWYYEEHDDVTHVTLEVDYEMGDSLFDRLVRPVATRYNERQFRQILSNSKDLIEAELEAETTVSA